MKTVGFDGGHTIYELGPVSDVQLFFDCIQECVVPRNPDTDWTLLTDRLYRRYLRQAELEPASVLMERARTVLLSLPTNSMDWEGLDSFDPGSSRLDMAGESLGDVFSLYFQLFTKATDSALSFLSEFSIYQPVRVISSSLPLFAIEKDASLDQYDELASNEKPLWLRQISSA
jgi:hypothetical protein